LVGVLSWASSGIIDLVTDYGEYLKRGFLAGHSAEVSAIHDRVNRNPGRKTNS